MRISGLSLRRVIARHLHPRLLNRLRIWRVGKVATLLFGPQFHRSRRRIELNITFACNLRCVNCDRSCEQAPTSMHMSVQQVQTFIEESIATGYKWDDIVLIGGEPTIHPDFLKIVEALRQYINLHAPLTRIIVFTNGFGRKVNDMIECLPGDIVVENSEKDGTTPIVSYHRSFNVAPVDLPVYRNADYRNGCWITQQCGIALGPSGYYPCGAAAGMDRILGLDAGRQALPREDDSMDDLLNTFCRNCGHFKREPEALPAPAGQSAAWQNAYAAYKTRKPKLNEYGAPAKQDFPILPQDSARERSAAHL